MPSGLFISLPVISSESLLLVIEKAASGGLGQPECEQLTLLLKRPSVDVVGAAATALRSSAEPLDDACVRALASLQAHGSAQARQAAAWALARAPTRASTETLLALTLDPDEKVRRGALDVLSGCDPSTLHRGALGKFVPRAVAVLAEGDTALRLAALQLLGLIDSVLRELDMPS